MRIIYKTEEGGVAVLIPTPEYLQDHTIEELAAKDVPEGAEFEIVKDSDVPSDRTFRGAWEKVGKAIEANIIKAKVLTKDRLREERKPLLETQDILFNRALEGNEDTSVIVAEKNRLRNITKQVDGMKTLDELKGVSV